jgi:hypothetical protein
VALPSVAVQIDILRRGWPEQVLTGRYTFATRRRDGLLQRLFDTADILTDGLIEKERRDQLHLRIDEQPAMIVLTGAYQQLPPGIKICGLAPLSALLVLCERRENGGLFAPARYDVVDHRLGVVIGMLETTGGFVRPARTVIYDDAGQVRGVLTQPAATLAGSWLLGGRNRYDISVHGARVARVQQVRRWLRREYQVDVTRAAGAIDPRLVLACVLQKVHSLSGY